MKRCVGTTVVAMAVLLTAGMVQATLIGSLHALTSQDVNDVDRHDSFTTRIITDGGNADTKGTVPAISLSWRGHLLTRTAFPGPAAITRERISAHSVGPRGSMI